MIEIKLNVYNTFDGNKLGRFYGEMNRCSISKIQIRKMLCRISGSWPQMRRLSSTIATLETHNEDEGRKLSVRFGNVLIRDLCDCLMTMDVFECNSLIT